LHKQAMITKIQLYWRARKWRQSLRILPVELVVQKRSVLCIIEWWKYNKMIKTINAKGYIGKHVREIKSNEIYLEQTIYQNINKIVSEAHDALRFKE
jgi:hypothetical protein